MGEDWGDGGFDMVYAAVQALGAGGVSGRCADCGVWADSGGVQERAGWGTGVSERLGEEQ